jgi:hypothetical protein
MLRHNGFRLPMAPAHPHSLQTCGIGKDGIRSFPNVNGGENYDHTQVSILFTSVGLYGRLAEAVEDDRTYVETR